MYAQREAEQQLRAAIDRLGPQLRRAIQLRQTKDYSTKEIALELGISVAAAKSRLLRAKAGLRASTLWSRFPGPEKATVNSQAHP